MSWALTPGKIYVLDTEPTGNDPDNITSIGTEGINHTVMNIPQRLNDVMSSKKKYYDFPGSEGMVLPLDYWSGRITVNGHIISDPPSSLSGTMTRLANWKQFVATENEDTSLYLVICFGANNYWPFWDYSASTIRQYCEGCFVDNDLVGKYIYDEPLTIPTQITWKANW
jgi:hypothetical protein